MQGKYEWVPTATAPSEFPAYTMIGFLGFQNGSTVRLPGDNVTASGWGETGAIELIEPRFKPIPVSLDAVWFSVIESKFYHATFKLPLQLVESTFAAGFRAPPGEEPTPISRVIVGYAPGGDVAVWARGGRVVHMLGMFKAQEVNMRVSELIKNPDMSEQDFINDCLKGIITDQRLREIKSSPLPLGHWADLDRRYNWFPYLRGEYSEILIWVKGANGEQDWFAQGADNAVTTSATKQLPRPDVLNASWKMKNGRQYVARIQFSLPHLTKAFDALHTQQPGSNIHMEMMIGDIEPRISILLRNGNQVVPLREISYTVNAR